MLVFYEHIHKVLYSAILLDSFITIIKKLGHFIPSKFTVKYTGEQQYKNENRIVFNF